MGPRPSRGRFVTAGGAAAAAAALGLPARAENGSAYGVVGFIKPTLRPGSLESLIRLLPDGIGALPVYLDVKRGTEDEFATAIPAYEKDVALLAGERCDLIHAEGAPPFMIVGYRREAELIRGWESRYNTPIFTSSQNQVNALRAVGAKRIVGATYFSGSINATYGRYFTDAGIAVLSMDGISAPFDKVQDIPPLQIYNYIKKSVLAHPGADAIYMLGSGWRTLDIIEPLERDLGLPVIHPVAARAWEILRRLHLRRPVAGYGTLLATLP